MMENGKHTRMKVFVGIIFLINGCDPKLISIQELYPFLENNTHKTIYST